MLNTRKKELAGSWLKKRRDSIFKRLLNKRLSKRQPIQSKIDIYFALEASSNEPMQVQFDKKEDKEAPGKKTYARVDHHSKKNNFKRSKKCWNCKSRYHYKENCLKIQCFYCREIGHIKANCWRKKLDFIYKILRDNDEKKEKEKKKRRRRKLNKQERRKQLKIIGNRAMNIDYKLFKTDKGDKNFSFWKGIKIGQILGDNPPLSFPQKFR